MPKTRYEKIKFSKMDGLSGLKYYDKLKPGAINLSERILPDFLTKRIKLAEEFAKFTISSAQQYAYNQPVSCRHKGTSYDSVYHLVYKSNATRVELYRQTPYAAPALIKNFGLPSSNAYMLCSYRNLLLAWYYSGAIQQDYSSNEGVTFTNQAWAYSIPRDYFIADDLTLYVRTDDELVKSTDGINWTVVYQADVDYSEIVGADELDGESYIALSDYYSTFNFLCKLDADDNPKIIRNFDGGQMPITIKKFDNRIIIADYVPGRVLIYQWDKGDLKQIAYYDSDSIAYMSFLYADDKYLYLVLNRSTILRMNTKNAIYRLATISPTVNTDMIGNILKFNGNICMSTSEYTAPSFNFLMHKSDANEERQASGYFTTPCIDKKHIPAYLITRHKPLGDNASVVIKAKTNHGATFATTLISDTTNDSIGQTVALKILLDEVDAIEFEVTLADSGNDGDIVDFEFYYLYVPTGMEN